MVTIMEQIMVSLMGTLKDPNAEEDAALDLEQVRGPESVGPGPITCSNQHGVERCAATRERE